MFDSNLESKMKLEILSEVEELGVILITWRPNVSDVLYHFPSVDSIASPGRIENECQ